MDLYCPICVQAHGLAALHDQADAEGRSFDAVREDFYERGCQALGESHGFLVPLPERQVIAAIYELFGADVDGAMVELWDYISRNAEPAS